jgi:predicted Fe-Mo cluster-binding NifX family protein
MKVALTVWEDTVSTVCDFSSRLLVFDVMGHEVKNKSFIPFKNGLLPARVNQLKALGVEVLLCGAISQPLERMIRASGVKVIPCLRGSIEDVIAAYLVDGLSDARFILPGFGPGASCVRAGRRHRGLACRFPAMVKDSNREGQG